MAFVDDRYLLVRTGPSQSCENSKHPQKEQQQIMVRLETLKAE